MWDKTDILSRRDISNYLLHKRVYRFLEERNEWIHSWNVNVDLAISILMHGRVALGEILIDEPEVLASLSIESSLS